MAINSLLNFMTTLDYYDNLNLEQTSGRIGEGMA